MAILFGFMISACSTTPANSVSRGTAAYRAPANCSSVSDEKAQYVKFPAMSVKIQDDQGRDVILDSRVLIQWSYSVNKEPKQLSVDVVSEDDQEVANGVLQIPERCMAKLANHPQAPKISLLLLDHGCYADKGKPGRCFYDLPLAPYLDQDGRTVKVWTSFQPKFRFLNALPLAN